MVLTMFSLGVKPPPPVIGEYFQPPSGLPVLGTVSDPWIAQAPVSKCFSSITRKFDFQLEKPFLFIRRAAIRFSFSK
jgi:hypothetical protein